MLRSPGIADIETDYLVIGAGLAGLGFTDALIAGSDADVVLVDRRHRPGGHWNDAYPFVRLHLPAANYGVASRELGTQTIDQTGPNAGYYQQATAAEVCDYFNRVLEETLLASGQVRFFGMSDYEEHSGDGHRFTSRLTGETTRVKVRRKVVDATYLESSVPATHTPPFEVGDGAHLVTPNDLVHLDEPASGYTVLGSGKTAMDTCNWLLAAGVPPDAIRWVKPREAWLHDRAFLQPLDLVTLFVEGLSLQLEAAAEAENEADLFQRLEAAGQLMRVDPGVEPTMFKGPTLSAAECEELRRLTDVVRMGKVRRLGADEIVLDEGAIPTDPGQAHIDCTAKGLRTAPARPIFEADRITPQQVRFGQASFNSALVGFLEASDRDDAEKNRLCPATPYPNVPADWITIHYMTHSTEPTRSAEPDVDAWVKSCRLNLAAGIGAHVEDPGMKPALDRLLGNMAPAVENLGRLSGVS